MISLTKRQQMIKIKQNTLRDTENSAYQISAYQRAMVFGGGGMGERSLSHGDEWQLEHMGSDYLPLCTDVKL